MQPFSVKIIIDQKQPENVESSKYLDKMLTNDGRCTCEIKSIIAVAKAAFNKKMALFTSTVDLKLRKNLYSKLLHLEHSFIWCGIFGQ
jgi:hypothetical protein